MTGPGAGVAEGNGTSAGRWAILQHVAHEGPALIADGLRRAGQRVDVVRLDRGEPLPEEGSFAGLVVLGGPMGVSEGDSHAWLAWERALLAATATDGRPVLGVCLGAQQLAMALGAEVTTGAAPEIGLGQVELTGPGRLDPVTGPEYGGLSATTIPCVHWHHDTFSLPDGAVHLAASQRFPHQAFRWGDRAYGLQFHVEVDRALAEAWEPYLPPGVTLSRSGLAQVETAGRRLIQRFVQRATSPLSSGRRPPAGHVAGGPQGEGR